MACCVINSDRLCMQIALAAWMPSGFDRVHRQGVIRFEVDQLIAVLEYVHLC